MGGFSTVTPSSTNIAQTVWSYGPRTLTDIQSLVNAIQNNNPSLLSTLGDLPFIPAPIYAGQVSLTQVASFISTLVQNYRAQGVIASFINSNPYSLWHTDFVESLLQNPYLGLTNASLILNGVSSSMLAEIATSTSVPVTSLLSFLSNAALSANAAQGLLYGMADNYYYNKWLQTVTYNAPSITFSTNATLSTNVLIAKEITISSGVTVTCGTHTCYFIAQVFNNQGTIVNPYGAAGGFGLLNVNGAPPGGTGGGGIVVIAMTTAIGTINVNGGNGGNPGISSKSYPGGGGFGNPGSFVVASGVTVPSGGNAGALSANGWGAGEPNGGGGGYSWTDAASGGSATIYSFPNGNALITYLIQGVSDWWLSNIIGKVPSSVTPLLFIYGSGGGGGGGGSSGYVGGGGGGGGGGEAIIYGYEVIAGTIDAAGGGGGNSTGAIAGGGGGGGVALVFYGPGGLSGTMSYSLAGGAGGVGSTSIYNGYPGGTGSYLAASVTVNG
jgi:hypothetical protein